MKILLALLLLATAVPVVRADYCRPYVVSTCEVCRSRQCYHATDYCGHCYTYHVTVITYRSYYSDGCSSTYTRSYRS